MLRFAIIRTLMLGFLTSCLGSVAFAQSTISDKAFELTYGSGPFGVLLPPYELGTDVGGGTVFQDDGDTLGALWRVKAVRRFLGTRTSFETTAFYARAEANSSGTSVAANIPNPAGGGNVVLGAAPTHLESGLNHYGVDVALRDTWRTRFGGLSAGLAFSYLAFDQKFKLDSDSARVVTEDLNSDYVGGKGFVGWDGCIFGRRSKLDVGAGYFDLDVDYQFFGSAAIPGAASALLADHATTVESDFTTYFQMKGYDASFTVGAMYISDFAQIVHTPGIDASLTTDDAVLITGMVQIAL